MKMHVYRAAVVLIMIGAAMAGGDDAGAADRVAAARADKQAGIEKMFGEAGVSYPPDDVFIRVFKAESELELWAKNGSAPYTLVRTYPVCALSGKLGPKRRQGDRQVPEGVYRIVVWNPSSRFHLSLGLDYPNRSDRILGDKHDPGGDIFIHGNCVTIGCIPIQDDPIEELYLVTLDSRNKSGHQPAVNIFPCRMDQKDCRVRLGELSRDDPSLKQFWGDLAEINAYFEKNGAPPKIKISDDGRYRISD